MSSTKTPEHRAAIAGTMRTKSEIRTVARRKASDRLLAMAAGLGSEQTPATLDNLVRTLVAAVKDLVEADEASTSLSAEKIADLGAALSQSRKALEERGGNLATMDVTDIIRAKQIGLVSDREAQKELSRRRKTMTTHSLGMPARFPPGSQSGLLPCPKCSVMVDLSRGQSYCDEHLPPEPRIAGGLYKSVNLDEQLAEAEAAYSKAKVLMERTERTLTQVQSQIAEYDAAHGR